MTSMASFRLLAMGGCPPVTTPLSSQSTMGGQRVTRPRRDTPNAQRISVGTSEQIYERLGHLDFHDPYSVLEYAGRTGRIWRHLEPHEVKRIGHALLDATILMTDDRSGTELTGPRFGALGTLLLVDVSVLASTCVDTYEEGRCTAEQLLRFAIAIGPRLRPCDLGVISESVIRSLWEVAPALAASFDVTPAAADSLPENGDSTRLDRLHEVLGWEPATLALPRGEPITQLWTGIDADQLRDIQRSIELVPNRVLSQDALIAANFEWLMAQKTEQHLKLDAWWHEHRSSARVPYQYEIVAAPHIEARTPPPGTVNWAAIPCVTLAAALTVAALGEQHTTSAVRTLLSAARFAPRLVARDLVLARVLVASVPSGEADAVPGGTV